MRPKKLVVSAFGPYAGETELDFNELGDRTLFLIHGPTGSGKTTILDAMCFALYGVCSGEDRDIRRLRSDLADPASLTQVVFDFRLGSEDYRIFRRPEQPRPKKRGGGTTTAKAEAVLWRRTGLTEDKEEGVVLASQWTTVTEQAERLLGFRSDQFRQVVMLPQGEFRRLLMADSRQRQEILDVLFQTQLYRRIEDALKQAAKDLRNSITETSNYVKFILDQAEVPSREELLQQRDAATTALEQTRASLTGLTALEQQAQEKLNTARLALQRLKELREAETAFRSLDARVDEFVERRNTLGSARQAATILAEERNLEARTRESRQADIRVQKAREDLKRAAAEKESADTILEEETGKQSLRDDARKRLDRLEELTVRVEELQESAKKRGRAEKAWTLAAQEIQSVTQSIDQCKGAIEEIRDKRARAEKASDRTEFLALRCQEMEKATAQLAKMGKALKEENSLSKQLAEATQKATAAKETMEKAMAEQARLEAAWINGQSAVIASRLSPGQPCPVCGATDHPFPARSETPLPNEKAIKSLAARVDLLREEWENGRAEVARIENKLSAVRVEARLLRESLGPLAEKPSKEIASDYKAMKDQFIQAQESGRLVKVLSEEFHRQETLLADFEEKRVAVDEKKLKAQADLQQVEAELSVRKSGIPEDLQRPGALAKAKNIAQERLRRFEEALDTARKQAAAASEALTACKTSESAASENSTRAAQHLMNQREEFQKRLKEAGFADERLFRAAKKTLAEMERLENEIEAFDRSLSAAKDRLDRCKHAAEGIEQPDMDALQTAAAKARKDHQVAVQAEATLSAKRDRLHGWVEECSRLTEKIELLEEQYAVKGRIAEVATGGNREGITFQRFVLSALLDDVLLAASRRLRIMSNNRFLLQRIRERTDRRSAGGLDLEVHDEYTGTARPVSTLSGGESFLASLSLALGLADVVQSYSGGIQLDAVFVDEGFGSLDPEALDLALEALIDLQRQGRVVGIISHVPSLREIIDARLEVSSNRSGSTARFVIGCGRDG